MMKRFRGVEGRGRSGCFPPLSRLPRLPLPFEGYESFETVCRRVELVMVAFVRMGRGCEGKVWLEGDG